MVGVAMNWIDLAQNRVVVSWSVMISFDLKLNVLLTVHHSISVYENQRDALFIQFIKN
jgi:hypothetical protein